VRNGRAQEEPLGGQIGEINFELNCNLQDTNKENAEHATHHKCPGQGKSLVSHERKSEGKRPPVKKGKNTKGERFSIAEITRLRTQNRSRGREEKVKRKARVCFYGTKHPREGLRAKNNTILKKKLNRVKRTSHYHQNVR